MSPDTGAREPQPLRDSLVLAINGNPISADDAWAVLHEWDRLAALAAGVGVPPDADKSLGSAAENAARLDDAVRDALDYAVGWARQGITESDRLSHVAAVLTAALEANARAARFPNPEPAGVGEARPAEPPRDDCHRCGMPGHLCECDPVGAAENAAREATSRHTQACQPGLGPKRSPAGERATGASKPSIGTAKPTNRTSSSAGENAPVGAPAEEQPDARAPRYISTAQKVVELQAECGQLREALDEALSYRRTGRMPQEVLERLRAVSVSALRKERGDARGRAEAWAAHVRREAALTRERDGLREQLDAARQALDAVAGDIDRLPTNFGRDTLRKLVGIRDRARAALGDVAAPPNQTTDVVANSAKNAEIRGGDKEA